MITTTIDTPAAPVPPPVRITPEMVVDAYRATGIRPEREVFLVLDETRAQRLDLGSPAPCGCAEGALMADRLGIKRAERLMMCVDSSNSFAEFAHEFGVNEGYAWGFSNGYSFGGCTDEDDHPDFVLGFADGRAAWAAVREAFGLEATL